MILENLYYTKQITGLKSLLDLVTLMIADTKELAGWKVEVDARITDAKILRYQPDMTRDMYTNMQDLAKLFNATLSVIPAAKTIRFMLNAHLANNKPVYLAYLYDAEFDVEFDKTLRRI